MKVDIAIIGSGVVGASAALALAKHSQLTIALIDLKQPLAQVVAEASEFDPRVVALTQASQALLTTLGVWQNIDPARPCPYQHMHVWDNDGTSAIDFSAEQFNAPALGHIVEQRELVAALAKGLEQQKNIHCLWGHSVEALNEQTITLTNGTHITATLLVAADGSQSTLRQLAHFQEQRWSYQQRAIVATVKTEQSHQYTAWQNFLSTGPLAFLPLAHKSNRYCSIVWSADTERANELMALEEAAFNHQLTRAFDNTLGAVELVDKRYSFPLKQFNAPSYYRQGLVLVGDAAHVIHPLAGQGVNLGLLDVSVLVEEINYALARGLSVGEPTILSRYQRGRKPHNLQVMALMEGLKRLFGATALSIRWLRNTGLAKVNSAGWLKKQLAQKAMGLK